LDSTPVVKNALPKLRCRPIRLVEPFAQEADIYFRNLEKLPTEEKERFTIPLTSMKTEDTEEWYPPGKAPKSKFYTNLPENMGELK
jgi:hypothetical protein